VIQHLNGLLKPTSGEIIVDGVNIFKSKETLKDVRFKVGLVFQYPEAQLFEETVFADIAFGPKNMGLDADEIKRRVYQAAELVGITAAAADGEQGEEESRAQHPGATIAQVATRAHHDCRSCGACCRARRCAR
jgi:energy-coupling factor transport system ATP-binding protein